MNVADLPFNRHLGLTVSPEGQVALPVTECHHNHLGTVHASALYALAEACSGEWVIRHLASALPDALAVTRTGAIQYKKPALSSLTATVVKTSIPTAEVVQRVSERGMGRIALEVEIGCDGNVVATASFEWVIQRGR